MAVLSSYLFKFYLLLLLVYLVQLQFGEAQENTTATATHYNDTCFKGRTSLYPCSSVISGNLLLIIFYGLLLAAAAKLISDGAELLLDVGVSASIVGGLILPLLGAVPDSAIIIVSGLGDKEEAQQKLAVGMGTLAGSTIMLLTIAWAGSLIIGRCNLDSKGESIDGTGKGEGITLQPEFKSGLIIMFITSIFYLVVQSADWRFGPTNDTHPQPKYVKNSALATMILCFVGLFGYFAFMMYDSKAAEMRAKKHRAENIQRKVLHHMLLLADRQVFKPAPKVEASPGGSSDETEGYDLSNHCCVGKGILDVGFNCDSFALDAAHAAAEEHGLSKKYFKAWHMKKSMKPIAGEAAKGSADPESQVLIKEDDVQEGPRPEVESDETEKEEEESKWKIGLKSAVMLTVGVAMVSIFSDPMCDALDALTNKKNHPHYLDINPFYVSFIVTPFCSNASELLSSLIFASRRKRENATITFSQIFGACTMNNTMCLGIFMALVYFRDLEWYYSAEVLVILIAQWVIGFISFRQTYKLFLAVPVMCMYVVSLVLVYILETYLHWK
eukprot:gene1415-1567_t